MLFKKTIVFLITIIFIYFNIILKNVLNVYQAVKMLKFKVE
ncbi:hypothetical protein JCM19301_3562 [Jejuia pallidilutea]|uniref:Uncharacterized protein n=1 Tax=Jejuia pallidilutea TaxID=504487 RepID=A0A090WEC6_9FLAO|nr:hypothetical protein JCM19301_3562 [Jejuia pallidilutea]GAL71511.1 hypothetical protein JCM19302_1680 [Jejuia pallidilutea]GAL88486.1 hypothetical protein JCM19538_2999 [Jejuia pallidilutea]